VSPGRSKEADHPFCATYAQAIESGKMVFIQTSRGGAVKNTKVIRFLVACAAYVVVEAAFAAHPLVTDDTGTQGTGNNQLEINTDRGRDDGVSSQSAALTYTYGLRDALDVFVTVPASTTSPSGISDASIGAKWRFMESEKTSLGLKSELFFPTGDESPSSSSRPAMKIAGWGRGGRARA
jgi:hypothetical protein